MAINAQLLPDQGSGGVESVLIGLTSALGQLDGPEEYLVIGHWEEPDWLQPYLGQNSRIVRGPRPPHLMIREPSGLEPLKRALGPFRDPVRTIWRKLSPLPPAPLPRLWPEVPITDGFYEGLDCDVIHFPSQSFTLCALPSIYNPHDLQHLHYPTFFPPSVIAWRETIYPAGCHLAHTVVVGSQWVKQDIERHYRVHPDKVQVIPWAPPTYAYSEPNPESLVDAKSRYRLEVPFALYPAMTWEHKNHLRLLEALALLRDRENLVIRLVCTGDRYSTHWSRIEELLRTLDLNDQVKFLGIVPREQLRSLYRLAQFVVVPTLFEAASGPVFEAWHERVPVACSTVTSLPEQVGNAALLFDPFSVEAIADAVKRMSTDEHLRVELIRRGQRRLHDFSWDRTAKAYRAVYRQASRGPLSEEDRSLLAWDWMREPMHLERGIT